VPPTPKTNYVDIPGGNGTLDLSEALTGFPVFNDRTGTFQFRVMNGYKKWHERYSEIMSYLHGRRMRAVLADDPDWFYEGRFSVDGWDSGDTWSVVTIGYNVNPYKWSIISSTERWKWDPFNFQTGIIWQATFSNIIINSSVEPVSQNFPGVFFGESPVSPTFTIAGSDSAGITVHFVNSRLNIDLSLNFKDGVHFVPDFLFWGADDYPMEFTGVGTISIDFRVGRL
jgi:hypothetical protein